MKIENDKSKKWKTTKKPPGHKPLLRGNKEMLEHLQSARVVQRDLVYVIGLSPRIASKSVSRAFTQLSPRSSPSQSTWASTAPSKRLL